MEYEQQQARKKTWWKDYMKRRRDGFKAKGICPSCMKRKAVPGRTCCAICLEHKKINTRARNSKMSTDEYRTALKKQKNLCAICRKKRDLVVDHCHKKLKVRGLLCHNCNVALGKFFDDVVILKRAIKYLSTSRSA
jgi:hypothetical protein